MYAMICGMGWYAVDGGNYSEPQSRAVFPQHACRFSDRYTLWISHSAQKDALTNRSSLFKIMKQYNLHYYSNKWLFSYLECQQIRPPFYLIYTTKVGCLYCWPIGGAVSCRSVQNTVQLPAIRAENGPIVSSQGQGLIMAIFRWGILWI